MMLDGILGSDRQKGDGLSLNSCSFPSLAQDAAGRRRVGCEPTWITWGEGQTPGPFASVRLYKVRF